MTENLLKAVEVDLLLRYPIGRAAKLAKKGLLPHVVLPDGSVRFERDQLEAALRAGRVKAVQV